jgi:hypothetical protein
VVLPNVSEQAANQSDGRLAFNAVCSVDALAAHIFFWCRTHVPDSVKDYKNDSVFRNHLSDRNTSFRILRDLANAQKHVTLIYKDPLIKAADRISERMLGWDEATWDEGYWDGVSQIVVETVVGELKVVSTAVQEALEFLKSEMDCLGIE